MAQIRIHLDGTFEAVAAAPKSLIEHKRRVAELTKDLKTAKAIDKHRKAMEKARDRIATLKTTPASPAKAAKVEAQKTIVASSKQHIAALKKTLSSSRHTDPAAVQTLLSNAKVAHREKGAQVTKDNRVRMSSHTALLKGIEPKAGIAVLERHIRSVEKANNDGKGDEDHNLDRIRQAKKDIALLKSGKQPKLMWTKHLFEKKPAKK